MIVSQFSCGAASAVATMLAIADHGSANVRIINAFLAREDSDNRRFLADCEVWFGKKIEVFADTKYGADPFDVFRRKRFIKGKHGAPCTGALKRSVLNAAVSASDTFILGYTIEEVGRVNKFLDANNGRKIITPLIDRNLTKEDCFAIIDRAGIELPRPYRQGYKNANCRHCPKGGQAYHQNCREDFPESFAELVQIQDVIGPGSYFLRFRSGPRKGERMSLRELPAGRGDMKSEPDFQCGVLCELAESDIAEPKGKE